MILVSGLVIALQYKPVQSYFGKQAAKFLASELQTTISIDGLYLKPFSSFTLEGLYMADRTGDTLLYAGNLQASLDLAKIFQNQIVIHDVKLSSSSFFLKTEAEGQSSAKFVIDYFKPRQPLDKRRRIVLDLKELQLENISFRYRNMMDSLSHDGSIDFADLQVSEVNGHLKGIDFKEHWLSTQIEHFSFIEKSGFQLRGLAGDLVVDAQFIELNNLELQTNQSLLRDKLRLSFQDYEAFNNFLTDVQVDFHSDRSRITSEDIAFFAPEVRRTSFDVRLSGDLGGTVDHIQGRQLTLSMASQTQLSGDLEIHGLPAIEDTQFDLHLTRLTSNFGEIQSLTQLLADRPDFALPVELSPLGTVNFNGALSGRYHDFFAEGVLATALGRFQTSLNFDIKDDIHYAGHLSAKELDLGLWTKQSNLGFTAFEMEIDGRSFDLAELNGALSSQIHYLDFRGHRYQNIFVSGQIDQKQIFGEISIEDRLLQMQGRGMVDLFQDTPKFEWDGTVEHASLHELKLYEREPLVLNNLSLTSQLQGNSLNLLTGRVTLNEMDFSLGAQNYQVSALDLQVEGDPDDKHIRLDSDLLDATIQGKIDLPSLPDYFTALVSHYLPSLGLKYTSSPQKQDFEVRIDIKDFEPLAEFISPKLEIAGESWIRGRFSEEQNSFDLNLHLREGRWGDLEVRQITIKDQGEADGMDMLLTAENLSYKGTEYAQQIHARQRIIDDKLTYEIRLEGDSITELNRMALRGEVRFEQNQSAEMLLSSSTLTVNGETWEIGARSLWDFTRNQLYVSDFEMVNAAQKIIAEGWISSNIEEALHLEFQEFGLHALNPFVLSSGYQIEGVINGRTEISAILNRPFAVADLAVDQVSLNDIPLGDLKLKADFDQEAQRINVQLQVHEKSKQIMAMEGTYNILDSENPLSMRALFQDLNLALAQPPLANLVTGIQGQMTGSAAITGSINQPKITGNAKLASGKFRVDYLNTTYQLSGPVIMENTRFLLNEMILTDIVGQRALVNGQIDLNQVRNPAIDVQINATNFMVLNTGLRDNPLYYGTAFGTGSFRFQGRADQMNIQINARTDDNTVINIPLNYSSTLGDSDFIRFTDPSTKADSLPPVLPNRTQGLNMNMALQVTSSTEAHIFTDLGELSGRGEGQLDLRISSLGDFEMFGDYRINSGKFTFTAQDFINKIFEIRQGGSIRWTGRPTEAQVNLTAFYEQRTSLSALYDAAGRPPNEQRVLAQAEMDLSGQLTQPTIAFGLNFPQDPYVNDELQSYLSDANNVNQQALSLIVRRSFIPGSSSDFSRELNSTLLSAGTELAFNQLNNFIAQSLNLNFVDFNIRSLNDASASFRFFNDRLVFTGGITDRRDQQLNDLNVFSNRVATDAELLYLIRRDGRLVLRGSNRLNTRHFLLNPTDEYISALGLIYRQEFNNFGDFFLRILSRRRSEAIRPPLAN